MGSTRLPGKILRDLCGRPMLAWLVDRVARSGSASEVVIATTTDETDDATEALAAQLGVRCFRGHPTDVLDRIAAAAAAAGAETVARVSGDSPFLDPTPVDAVLETFARGECDLAENHREPGWPVGTAVEALSRETLDRIAAAATEPHHREHVTLYAYESDEPIRVEHVPVPRAVASSDLRLCVDTAEDFARAERIAGALGPGEHFSLAQIVALARSQPEVVA
jgi:spore coat polysaccharide biosynthesis protein SpsF